MSSSRAHRFAQLFLESQVALRRYVQRFVGSRESAEEIAQEAFLRTYEQGEGVQTPRAFLFSTARNIALNADRDERKARTHSVGDFDELRLLVQQPSAEEEALTEEESRLVRDVVERLPPQCRAVFTLRLFQGYSYKEIAQQLGLSRKTVENHVARGFRETHAALARRYRDLRRP